MLSIILQPEGDQVGSLTPEEARKLAEAQLNYAKQNESIVNRVIDYINTVRKRDNFEAELRILWGGGKK